MDSHVKVFSQETGQVVQETDIHYDSSVFPRDAALITPPSIVQSVRFCNFNPKQLLTAHDDLAVRLLHLSAYRLSEAKVERQHYDAVRHIEVAVDDLMFVSTCQDGSVYLWNLEFMQAYMTLTGNSQIVVTAMQSCAAMTRDRRTVLTGCYDHCMRLYRLP
jgi:WD40 repeat protein